MRSGLTAVDLAARTGIGRHKISRVENGRRLPNANEIRSWVATCGGADTEADALVGLLPGAAAMVREWADRVKGGQADIQREYYDLAAGSKRVAYVEPILIPGPLQTEDYANQMLTWSERRHRSEPDAVSVAEAVRWRTAIGDLMADQSKTFTFVISRLCLITHYIPAEQMLIQLHQVMRAFDYPNVTLAVIPSREQIGDMIPPAFQLFGDELRQDTGRVEVQQRAGGLSVAGGEQMLDRALAIARSGVEAQAIVEREIAVLRG